MRETGKDMRGKNTRGRVRSSREATCANSREQWDGAKARRESGHFHVCQDTLASVTSAALPFCPNVK